MNSENRPIHKSCPNGKGTWGPITTQRSIHAPTNATHFCSGCGAYAEVEQYIQHYAPIICGSTNGGNACKQPADGGYVLSGARGLVPRCSEHHDLNLAT